MIKMNRKCDVCKQAAIWDEFEEKIETPLIEIDEGADVVSRLIDEVPIIEALPKTPAQQARWDQEVAYRIESSTRVSATVVLLLSGVEAALEGASQIDCAEAIHTQTDACPRLESILPRLQACVEEFGIARAKLTEQGLPF